MQLRQIEIDFDIHQMIELERRSFDEKPYIALRRLLNLPEKSPAASPTAVTNTATNTASQDEGMPFFADGVSIPHGSIARMKYQRGTQVYEGRFLNGKLIVNGKSYSALSPAASDLGITKDGKKTSLDGWNYWEVKFPGENRWKRLRDLRNEARKGTHS
jgi:hypothetical protein